MISVKAVYASWRLLTVVKAASLVIRDSMQSPLDKLPPARNSSGQKQLQGTGGGRGGEQGEHQLLRFYVSSSQVETPSVLIIGLFCPVGEE